MRQNIAVNRNHSVEPMFEREGKSVATEQGAGVEGCNPTHVSGGAPRTYEEGLMANTPCRYITTGGVRLLRISRPRSEVCPP